MFIKLKTTTLSYSPYRKDQKKMDIYINVNRILWIRKDEMDDYTAVGIDGSDPIDVDETPEEIVEMIARMKEVRNGNH